MLDNGVDVPTLGWLSWFWLDAWLKCVCVIGGILVSMHILLKHFDLLVKHSLFIPSPLLAPNFFLFVSLLFFASEHIHPFCTLIGRH